MTKTTKGIVLIGVGVVGGYLLRRALFPGGACADTVAAGEMSMPATSSIWERVRNATSGPMGLDGLLGINLGNLGGCC